MVKNCVPAIIAVVCYADDNDDDNDDKWGCTGCVMRIKFYEIEEREGFVINTEKSASPLILCHCLFLPPWSFLASEKYRMSL